MTKDEMIKGLRYKAENIKAHMESEFFAEVADYLEEQRWECLKVISKPYSTGARLEEGQKKRRKPGGSAAQCVTRRDAKEEQMTVT